MSVQDARARLVVGVSGASGIPLAALLLDEVRQAGIESHLVMTRGAELACQEEWGTDPGELRAKADVSYERGDVGASIASGTYQTLGMIVVPCSMKTVAGIASGYSDNLLLRAADVTIKERRPLVLAARESPLSPIHLRNMCELARIPNVFVMPPVLTYYNGATTVHDMEQHLVGKMLSVFGVTVPGFRRWGSE